jgi:perosamine synthetase
VGTRGHPTAFAFYANKQMTTGEGGVLVPNGERMAARVRSERNQGRTANMEEVDHERLGFNYRLTDVAAAIGVAQLERLDELLAARARVAAMYRRRLTAMGAAPAGEADSEQVVLPNEDRGAERRSWFVYCVQLPEFVDRGGVISELARRGIASKAYLPCIHLLAPYRERFGFRGGEFPVAERTAARSLALPFYSALGEDGVERVCAALAAALERDSVPR